MPNRKLTIELPEDLVSELGSMEELASKAKEALVIYLVRESSISQGKAAELLGVARWEVLDLMAQYRVPSGPETSDEMAQELEEARRAARDKLAG